MSATARPSRRFGEKRAVWILVAGAISGLTAAVCFATVRIASLLLVSTSPAVGAAWWGVAAGTVATVLATATFYIRGRAKDFLSALWLLVAPAVALAGAAWLLTSAAHELLDKFVKPTLPVAAALSDCHEVSSGEGGDHHDTVCTFTWRYDGRTCSATADGAGEDTVPPAVKVIRIDSRDPCRSSLIDPYGLRLTTPVLLGVLGLAATFSSARGYRALVAALREEYT
ncbi:hypothetical protein NGB36_28245 [Streptomyces sp. RB6PN25]|uniref:Integral membrane protein n=1 Tax=Streptomyces humicola TaxID=2953240 RepID=A0ABT1Q6F5_9ACTN|nr:hypothetical protein [Streptomyces humicola]MCQ4084367.1 hypothetical protein [Streptomyces humicola]